MAKATDPHYDPKKPDATKATRAKVCRARKQGVRIDGKLVRFGARGKAKTEKKVASAKGKGGQGKGKGKAGRNTAKPTHDHHETSPANQGREGRRSA